MLQRVLLGLLILCSTTGLALAGLPAGGCMEEEAEGLEAGETQQAGDVKADTGGGRVRVLFPWRPLKLRIRQPMAPHRPVDLPSLVPRIRLLRLQV